MSRKSYYKKVEKHSQKKEHPDTFVVGIRVGYDYHDLYRSMTIDERSGLKSAIQSYLKSLAK